MSDRGKASFVTMDPNGNNVDQGLAQSPNIDNSLSQVLNVADALNKSFSMDDPIIEKCSRGSSSFKMGEQIKCSLTDKIKTKGIAQGIAAVADDIIPPIIRQLSGKKNEDPKNSVIKKGSDEHPGFKAVQNKIEGEGYTKEQAGAILASKTRHASASAKAKNPNLNRVKGLSSLLEEKSVNSHLLAGGAGLTGGLYLGSKLFNSSPGSKTSQDLKKDYEQKKTEEKLQKDQMRDLAKDQRELERSVRQSSPRLHSGHYGGYKDIDVKKGLIEDED